MAEHDRHDRREPAQRPRTDDGTDMTAQRNPLLALQHQAGNSAVAQLLSVQRHHLVPEEEAGR